MQLILLAISDNIYLIHSILGVREPDIDDFAFIFLLIFISFR